jgi:hypothetical protein
MAKRTLLVVGWSMAMLAPACTDAGSENASGTPLPLEDGRLTVKGGAVTKVEEQYFP